MVTAKTATITAMCDRSVYSWYSSL